MRNSPCANRCVSDVFFLLFILMICAFYLQISFLYYFSPTSLFISSTQWLSSFSQSLSLSISFSFFYKLIFWKLDPPWTFLCTACSFLVRKNLLRSSEYIPRCSPTEMCVLKIFLFNLSPLRVIKLILKSSIIFMNMWVDWTVMRAKVSPRSGKKPSRLSCPGVQARYEIFVCSEELIVFSILLAAGQPCPITVWPPLDFSTAAGSFGVSGGISWVTPAERHRRRVVRLV